MKHGCAFTAIAQNKTTIFSMILFFINNLLSRAPAADFLQQIHKGPVILVGIISDHIGLPGMETINLVSIVGHGSKFLDMSCQSFHIKIFFQKNAIIMINHYFTRPPTFVAMQGMPKDIASMIDTGTPSLELTLRNT